MPSNSSFFNGSHRAKLHRLFVTEKAEAILWLSLYFCLNREQAPSQAISAGSLGGCAGHIQSREIGAPNVHVVIFCAGISITRSICPFGATRTMQLPKKRQF